MLNDSGKKIKALFLSGTLLLSAMTGYGGASLQIGNNATVQNSIPVCLLSDNLSDHDHLSDDLDTPADAITRSDTILTESSEALTIPEIAVLAAPSVVEITTETVTSGNRIRQYVSEGAGSGVIISEDGYIVTNNHVIEGAEKITVTLSDGARYTAALVGRDSQSDIAVIKVEADGLSTATLGNSEDLVVGELAVAIGNPLGQLGGTVTEGIISALNRTITIDSESMSLLQTTAAINPGNSGGGLFNRQGRLIGIVNAKSSGSDIEGLGFAIPVNTAKRVIEQLVTYGYVPGRVTIGAELIDIDDGLTAMMYRVRDTGVYVASVVGAAQLQAGDRIESVDGKAVSSAAEVSALVEAHGVGEVLSLMVSRNGQSLTVEVTLGERKY